MELEVYSKDGKKTGKKAKLSDDIFAIEPNDHAIYLDVKQYLANQRQGTHKAKERGEITGSRKKIKRQKGTGSARAGDIKNPLFRGGGRVFGPRPRNYGFKLNKKLKRVARKSALTYMAKDGNIMILEDIQMEAPKTQEFASMLASLDLKTNKSLIVVAEKDENVYKSSRNIADTKVVRADSLNTYDVLNAGTLILTKGSIEKIEATFNNGSDE